MSKSKMQEKIASSLAYSLLASAKKAPGLNAYKFRTSMIPSNERKTFLQAILQVSIVYFPLILIKDNSRSKLKNASLVMSYKIYEIFLIY